MTGDERTFRMFVQTAHPDGEGVGEQPVVGSLGTDPVAWRHAYQVLRAGLSPPVADIADALAPAASIDARAGAPNPRLQLQLAAAALNGDALRSAAQFSNYLASTTAAPVRRRIGFAIPGTEVAR